jgi:hypothetical protein
MKKVFIKNLGMVEISESNRNILKVNNLLNLLDNDVTTNEKSNNKSSVNVKGKK